MASGMSPSVPTTIVCVGMAGSGKTTFMQRLNAHLHERAQDSPATQPPYVLNLDPAVRSVPFDSNIDIRDSINYKEVMKQYNLGPNGGILTSLNLFSTKIDQVMGILEKRCLPQEPPTPLPSHIIVDTPGQIEVFVWSASGNILLSSLASSFPTVIAYVIDTPRTTDNTSTFMSNMLYAVSILYKTKLPMILVFNKTDVKSESNAVEWMRNFESFQDAVRQEEDDAREGSNYMGPLLNSMSLVLEEFYHHLSVVGVSSMTGDGMEEFLKAVHAKREEFETDYTPELERRRAEATQQKEQVRAQEVSRMMKDMRVSSKAGAKERLDRSVDPETVSDMEDADEDDDDDGGILDPDPLGEDESGKAFANEGLGARFDQVKSASLSRNNGHDTGPAADYIRNSQR